AVLPAIDAKPGISCQTLLLPAEQTLDVQLPWRATAPSLSKWKVDILHPVSGQVLSRSIKLGKVQQLDNGEGYRTTVKYWPAPAARSPNAQQELLRLSPPSPGDGPVIQLSLLTLIASSPIATSGAQKGVQTAILPQMGPFPNTVHIESAVYD